MVPSRFPSLDRPKVHVFTRFRSNQSRAVSLRKISSIQCFSDVFRISLLSFLSFTAPSPRFDASGSFDSGIGKMLASSTVLFLFRVLLCCFTSAALSPPSSKTTFSIGDRFCIIIIITITIIIKRSDKDSAPRPPREAQEEHAENISRETLGKSDWSERVREKKRTLKRIRYACLVLCVDFSRTAFLFHFRFTVMRASTRGAFIRSTLTAPLATTRRRRTIFFEGFVGSNQNMTESAVVTHTGTKPRCTHTLFSFGEPPPGSLSFFLRVLTLL